MADTAISGLTAATSVASADLIPIVQGGANKKATADLLPVSTATQAALDLKAPLASPDFTGLVDNASVDSLGSSNLRFRWGVNSGSAGMGLYSEFTDYSSQTYQSTNGGFGFNPTGVAGRAVAAYVVEERYDEPTRGFSSEMYLSMRSPGSVSVRPLQFNVFHGDTEDASAVAAEGYTNGAMLFDDFYLKRPGSAARWMDFTVNGSSEMQVDFKGNPVVLSVVNTLSGDQVTTFRGGTSVAFNFGAATGSGAGMKYTPATGFDFTINESTSPFKFKLSGTEVARLTTTGGDTGQLWLGYTSDQGFGAGLQVKGSGFVNDKLIIGRTASGASDVGLLVRNTNANGAGIGFEVASGNTGQIFVDNTHFLLRSTYDRYFRFDVNSGERLRITDSRMTVTNALTVTGLATVGSSTPASASAAGLAGTITWDADYIYVCTATNTWKRAAIATW